MKTKTKDIFNLTERQKEIAYCILFSIVLLLLLFGDKIALHFIKEEPNQNNTVFGENEKTKYHIDFLEELTIEEVLKKLESQESFLLLSSRNACETCDLYLPTIKSVKEEYKMHIYYIDRESMDENTLEYNLWKNISPVLTTHLQYTPYLMYYKEGQLEDELVGRKQKNELEDFVIKNNLANI